MSERENLLAMVLVFFMTCSGYDEASWRGHGTCSSFLQLPSPRLQPQYRTRRSRIQTWTNESRQSCFGSSKRRRTKSRTILQSTTRSPSCSHGADVREADRSCGRHGSCGSTAVGYGKAVGSGGGCGGVAGHGHSRKSVRGSSCCPFGTQEGSGSSCGC